jgi:hypothetical protein
MNQPGAKIKPRYRYSYNFRWWYWRGGALIRDTPSMMVAWPEVLW